MSEEIDNIKKILDNSSYFYKKDNIYVDKRTEDYAVNFGLQWNKFALTQYDSFTELPLTRNRLINSSEWKDEEINKKLIIELGSGAGRFTEILLSTNSYVVSVEMSDAIYANSKNNKSEKIIFIKSSLTDIEILNNLFDYVLCYGVAQHTPNIMKTYGACYKFGKKGSKISIDHYARLSYPTTKSIWRPITKRIKPSILLKIIKFYIPYYFPFDSFLRTKLPKILRLLIRLIFPIPCFNYINEKNIPQDKRVLIEWAIMDTFDALGAKYDKPLSEKELQKIAKTIGLEKYKIKKTSSILILNGVK